MDSAVGYCVPVTRTRDGLSFKTIRHKILTPYMAPGEWSPPTGLSCTPLGVAPPQVHQGQEPPSDRGGSGEGD